MECLPKLDIHAVNCTLLKNGGALLGMTVHSRIPPQLFEFQNKPGFFVTYFGDIYFGSLWECPGYDDGFFIIQNDMLRHAIGLKSNERTPERFRELGWEIKDNRIIKKVFSDGANFSDSKVAPIHFSGQVFKQMFVFGAAASTYCVFQEKEAFRKASFNPPTGFEIFDQKYDSFCTKYPGVTQSIPDFESKKRDTEGCMEEEWRHYRDVYNPSVTARHINIQFYLQNLFGHISQGVISNAYRYNLFNIFCRKLNQQLSSNPEQRAVLVSFNYDTILDHFLEEFSSPFRSMTDYFDWHKRSVVLFKPHGSWNWGWKFPDRFSTTPREQITAELFRKKIEPWQLNYELLGGIKDMVEYASWGLETMNNSQGKGRYTLNKNLIEVINSSQESSYYPALLLPYRDKDDFVMPYQQQHAMHACINQVTELFLIGWKGNEVLFNRHLFRNAKNLKSITIVNPNPNEVMANLQLAGFTPTRYLIKEIVDFESFVLNHMT